MTTRPMICLLALVISACAPTPPSPLGQAEVQEFVRQYMAATNAWDASKIMELINKDQTVSTITDGNIYRGWDAIRNITDESIAANPQEKITVGTIDVIALSSDSALVVASMSTSSLQVGSTAMDDVPGALTIIVKRTPAGLRLIHEHYSFRTE